MRETREMHYFVLGCCLLLGLIATPASAAESTNAAKHIVVDPGHGGQDTGASRGGAFESPIALLIAKNLATNLRRLGFTVTLTRDDDRHISLEDRALIANKAAADLFVSIHLNSSPDPRAQGKEFYFQNLLPVDEEAMYLANRENDDSVSDTASPAKDRAIQAGYLAAEAARLPKLAIEDSGVHNDVKRILEDLERNERVRRSSELAKAMAAEWAGSPAMGRTSTKAIRQAPFFLISNVVAPSILVEVGYLTHKREGVRLQQPDYQDALATALAGGIQRYFKTLP